MMSVHDSSPPEFAATREELDDRILVRVRGDIDMATADELLAALAPDSGRPFVVDLSEATFMDSTGLAALIKAHKQGAEIVIRKPSQIVATGTSRSSSADQLFTIDDH